MKSPATRYILLYTCTGHIHQDFFKKIPQNKRILFIYEGPVIIPCYYEEYYLKNFVRALTFHDDLVDNIKFWKYRYYCYRSMMEGVVPFKNRKFAFMMNKNAAYNHPFDLTAERRKIIEYYEKQPESLFDLYGTHWPKHLKNNKGPADDKINTIKHYKFCFCFENTKNVPGYITEKIFDCFAAGVIPIYYGAPNITDEVPENCFIDYRKFESVDAVHQYISTMSQETFDQYLINIRQFLKSDQAKKYTVETFAESAYKAMTD